MIDWLAILKIQKWGNGLLDEISYWRGKTKANDDLTILEIWRDQK